MPIAIAGAPLASCISVKAPDKPIEINLNVTIRQEVLVRLQRDVEQLINQNPQAFPQTPQMRKLVLLAMVLLAAPAGAQTAAVNAARAAGSVGERYDGYVGVAGAVAPAVRSQVATINIQRRSLYSKLAASKGVSPQDVGVTAGCQLLARVGVGETYLWADGKWRRRAAGQGAPIPDYCR